MVDERQRQRQMMFTDPNRQHYGPAGGPNKWDMDYPSGGMPTNYQGNSPHFRSGNLDVRYPGDYAHQQNQGRPYGGPGQPSHGYWQQMRVPEDTYPNVSGPVGGPMTFSNTYPSTDFYGPPWSPTKQHPNPRMRNINPRGMMGGIEGLEQETSGLWQTWKKILERTGNEDLANQWLSGQQTAAADTGIGSTNEYQTSGLWQTWKKILERTGNEDLANQWLESQYAV
jgi:hypothetical protein